MKNRKTLLCFSFLMTLLLLIAVPDVMAQKKKKKSKAERKAEEMAKLEEYYQNALDKSWTFEALTVMNSGAGSVTRDNNSSATPVQINPGNNWIIVDGEKIICNFVTIESGYAPAAGSLANTANQPLSAVIDEVLEYEVIRKKAGKPFSVSIRGRGTKPFNPVYYNRADKVDIDITVYSNGNATVTMRAGARGGQLTQYQGRYYPYDESDSKIERLDKQE